MQKHAKRSKAQVWTALGGIVVLAVMTAAALAQTKTAPKAQAKPNILVIFGDDIGMWNVGAYTHGMMGRTPKIDSLAKSGAIFTDH